MVCCASALHTEYEYIAAQISQVQHYTRQPYRDADDWEPA